VGERQKRFADSHSAETDSKETSARPPTSQASGCDTSDHGTKTENDLEHAKPKGAAAQWAGEVRRSRKRMVGVERRKHEGNAARKGRQ